jgi:hypothetical protein
MKIYLCLVCVVVFNDENWIPSRQKKNDRICKKCEYEQISLWRKNNPDKVKATWTRYTRKQGHRPFAENRRCPVFLQSKTESKDNISG